MIQENKNEVLMIDWNIYGIYVNGQFHNKTAKWWVKHDLPTDIYKEHYGATLLEASTEKGRGIMYQIVNGELKFVW